MSNMGFASFQDEGIGNVVSFVGPKSDYTKEEFIEKCKIESDCYYKYGEVQEGYCRYYPTAPEGIDIDGGCYGFCDEAGPGAFAVWYVDIE